MTRGAQCLNGFFELREPDRVLDLLRTQLLDLALEIRAARRWYSGERLEVCREELNRQTAGLREDPQGLWLDWGLAALHVADRPRAVPAGVAHVPDSERELFLT